MSFRSFCAELCSKVRSEPEMYLAGLAFGVVLVVCENSYIQLRAEIDHDRMLYATRGPAGPDTFREDLLRIIDARIAAKLREAGR